MSNRTRITPAIVAASAPAVVLPDSRPAGDTTSPFRAMLAASAGKVIASAPRARTAGEFPAVDSPAFPAAVLAACEATLASMAEPDAAGALSRVAERLNALGILPGKYSTGAVYSARSKHAGRAMWQRPTVALVVADATREAPAAE